MMGINGVDTAYLATFLVEVTRFNGSLHSKMRFVFARVGTPPVRLAGISFEHFCNRPIFIFAEKPIIP
ncbi:Hypothetical protein NGAL_HAMBI1146_50870 [Neorhizobium galegae bv. officinalis]|nr:Hypothetical protein NGAL_HAMBI1146_50870 [Neorhizobium galegae bv. officinalis]